jgi:hypothetical protein
MNLLTYTYILADGVKVPRRVFLSDCKTLMDAEIFVEIVERV